ncbi:hypothetical protein [Yoonia sediminilitoris]|uniref:Uncharacterized protein n=1 Tax=Yoonia sediminilitoris TaxID=1286148 RepID=A0A2T6KSA2_9RHOB|nr:hypothetical protein [Yoonia sediminilitoris]PUB19405.1 hypothetical protein C8N45_1011003 [Yoonia sediminilitoris]RCW99573.1 hypothetical protein DFP92_1011003 [Yoonia sediminilitoris]
MSGYARQDLERPLSFHLEGLTNTTVVIGDIARWKAEGRNVQALNGFHFIDIDELTPELLEKQKADMILSPLVAHNFDAVDVVSKLIELEFRGKYRAVSDDIPDSEIIRKEVQLFAPEIDFDLLLMPNPELGFN